MRSHVQVWIPVSFKAGVSLIAHLLTLFLSSSLPAKEPAKILEPELLSLFPSGLQRGTTIELQIRGKQIQDRDDVWLSDPGFRVIHRKFGPVSEQLPSGDQKKDPGQTDSESLPPVYRVQLEIDASARVGVHSLRIVGSRGVSNSLSFRVVDQPVVLQTEESRRTTKQGQDVPVPRLVNGVIAEPGALDYYAFDVVEGQKLSFDILMAQGFDPRLALYEPTGSWFDRNRPRRLLFDEERSTDMIPLKAHGTYRFPRQGRYLVEVSSLYGKGTPHLSYLLQIASTPETPWRDDTQQRSQDWRERTFTRNLESDWITILQSRALQTGNNSAAASTSAGFSSDSKNTKVGIPSEGTKGPPLSPGPIAFVEREPNNLSGEAMEISIPTLIEGRIEQPGDIDTYRFTVQAGQALTFEIETPDATLPHFNPRLGIVNSEDRELVTNMHKKTSLINNGGEVYSYLQALEPKVVHTFERGGQYFLQIRDITSRYGESRFSYRILVRLQIPHVGEVILKNLDRINLLPGQAKKLTVVTAHEEGFSGDVVFSFSGLPAGVEVFPAAEPNQNKAPTEVTENSDAIVVKLQETSIVLLASPDSPLTLIPLQVQMFARPLVNGQPGSPFFVKQIPLMVIAGSDLSDPELPVKGF